MDDPPYLTDRIAGTTDLALRVAAQDHALRGIYKFMRVDYDKLHNVTYRRGGTFDEAPVRAAASRGRQLPRRIGSGAGVVAVPEQASLTQLRGGNTGVLSLRAEFGQMTGDEYAAAVVFWSTPTAGPQLASRLFPRSHTVRIDRQNEDGFYRTNLRGEARVARGDTGQAVELYLQELPKQLALTPLLTWRGTVPMGPVQVAGTSVVGTPAAIGPGARLPPLAPGVTAADSARTPAAGRRPARAPQPGACERGVPWRADSLPAALLGSDRSPRHAVDRGQPDPRSNSPAANDPRVLPSPRPRRGAAPAS